MMLASQLNLICQDDQNEGQQPHTNLVSEHVIVDLNQINLT